MPFENFNDALSAAFKAYEAQDHTAFNVAAERAKSIVGEYPEFVAKLSEAQELFPASASISLFSDIGIELIHRRRAKK